jgi:drug/metabolite transporter (DMT)-like permease
MIKIIHKKSFKGYVLAGLAALSVSNVYIFSKSALAETPLYVFGFYWFLMAFSYNFILVTFTKKIILVRSYPPKVLKTLVVIGIFELLSAITFFASIQQIENPAIASFLVATVPVFVMLMSIPLLNEKFNKIEILGVLVTLGGVFMLSYSGKFSLNELFIKGANLSLLSAILLAVGLVIAKKNIKSIDPYLLALNRTVFLLLFYGIAMLLTYNSFHISHKAFFNIAMGSLFGPFLGAILQYNAFRFIEVSKESLVQNTHGLFVVISVYFYLGIFPLAVQIIGGIITIVGVTVMVLGKLYYQKSNK